MIGILILQIYKKNKNTNIMKTKEDNYKIDN